jgi:PAS domain-containing protein
MALQMGRLAQIGPWDWQVSTQKLTWSPELFRIHHADLGFEPTFEGMLAFYEPEARATLREAFEKAVRQGTPFDLELPIVTAGGQRHWVRFLGKAESKGGSTTHLYGAVQNITEIRESENARRRLETQLFQAQKMETLGTLAGGIAHDFNNLLTGILGYQELALDTLPEDHPSRTCLDAARGVSMRAREMVQQILTLSRQAGQRDGRGRPVGHRHRGGPRFLRTTVPGNVSVEAEIAPGCGRVHAEATQIHQVLLNLGQNAAHAMGATGGTIRIALAPVAVDAIQASALGNPGAGSLRAPVRKRHGPRHGRGDPEADLRPVLHDQGRRAGHGPRALRRARHRARAQGRDHRRERAGQGGDLLDLSQVRGGRRRDASTP